MTLSPLTLPAGFPLNLSIGILADCHAAIKFAFKLTGFLSALLQGLVSFRCRWWLGWQVWANPQFGFVLGKPIELTFLTFFSSLQQASSLTQTFGVVAFLISVECPLLNGLGIFVSCHDTCPPNTPASVFTTITVSLATAIEHFFYCKKPFTI
jgi:hypothetical protein